VLNLRTIAGSERGRLQNRFDRWLAMNHPISTLYDSEPALRDALVLAAKLRDTGAINSITDQLAERGLCRPRGDTSRLAELQSQCANRRAPA